VPDLHRSICVRLLFFSLSELEFTLMWPMISIAVCALSIAGVLTDNLILAFGPPIIVLAFGVLSEAKQAIDADCEKYYAEAINRPS
jgi:hypothetical protein